MGFLRREFCLESWEIVDWLTRCFGEFTGTTVLLLLNTAFVAPLLTYSQPIMGIVGGFFLLTSIYSHATISGAHLNPMVSLAMFINSLLRHLGKIEMAAAAKDGNESDGETEKQPKSRDESIEDQMAMGKLTHANQNQGMTIPEDEEMETLETIVNRKVGGKITTERQDSFASSTKGSTRHAGFSSGDGNRRSSNMPMLKGRRFGRRPDDDNCDDDSISQMFRLSDYIGGADEANFRFLDLIGYIIAQACGSAFGSFLAVTIVGNEDSLEMVCVLNDGKTVGQGLLAEATSTFILLTTVLYGLSPSNKAMDTVPLYVGLVLSCVATVYGSKSGGCMNPVRPLGPAIMHPTGACWPDYYLYWLGPLIGTVVALFGYRLHLISQAFKKRLAKRKGF